MEYTKSMCPSLQMQSLVTVYTIAPHIEGPRTTPWVLVRLHLRCTKVGLVTNETFLGSCWISIQSCTCIVPWLRHSAWLLPRSLLMACSIDVMWFYSNAWFNLLSGFRENSWLSKPRKVPFVNQTVFWVEKRENGMKLLECIGYSTKTRDNGLVVWEAKQMCAGMYVDRANPAQAPV